VLDLNHLERRAEVAKDVCHCVLRIR